MAAPTLVAASLTTSHNGSSTSYGGTYPTGLTDSDVLVAHIFAKSSTATISSVPAGWTLIDNQAGHSSAQQWLYWKPTTGSESGIVTWTGNGVVNSVLIVRMTGADRIVPFPSGETSKAGSSTDGTIATAPSVLTTGPDRLLLGFVSANNLGGFSSTAFTAEDYDSSAGSGGTARGMGLYEEARSTAGATGTRDVTVPLGTWAINMVAAKPAPPAAPTGLTGSVINT